MYSLRSRKVWAAVAVGLLVVAAGGENGQTPATASARTASPSDTGLGAVTMARSVVQSTAVEPVLRLAPRTGVPGTLVVVRSDSCPPPEGADFHSIGVTLHRPGSREELAYSSLVRILADWPGAPPFEVSRAPQYGPVPDGAAALREDGSWVLPLWIPYGTPAGEYVVRGECSATFDARGDTDRRLLVTYPPMSFVVDPWPAVPPTYTVHELAGGLLMDGDGNFHPWGWIPPAEVLLLESEGDPWSRRAVARGIALDTASSRSGVSMGGALVIDGFGGLHRFRYRGWQASFAQPHGAPYWPGWDISRGVAVREVSDASWTEGFDAGGLVLDGWGGLHPFTLGVGPPITITTRTGPYWPGWDIARDVALLPNGQGGYILDGWGGLHGFGLDGNPAPPKPKWQPYWPGWDIARGVVLLDDRSGYVFDAFGGAHSFSVDGAYQPAPPPTPYWPDQYVVQGAAVCC